MLSERFLKLRAWVVIAMMLLFTPCILVAIIVYIIYTSIFKKHKNISGEVALVTGGANGLGKEIAIGLAAKGCHIAVVDINEDAAKVTAKYLSDTYHVKAKAFKINITQYDEVAALSSDVEELLGPVTILVNNAGIMTFSSSDHPEPDEIQNMINTNLVAHIWTVRIFMKRMRELKKGHIVAISSMGGLFPVLRQMEYTATKFGVRGYMSALRTEFFALDCEFIKTTTVYPFFLKTNAKVIEMVKKSGMDGIYPSISGTEVAEAVINGILRNESEVFVPRLMGLFHRMNEYGIHLDDRQRRY